MSNLTLKDLERLQEVIREAGLDYQLELENGQISIRGPSDIVSSEVGVRLIAALYVWINPRRLGRVFDSAGGFILPNSNLKAPDVSFVKAERLRRSIRYFAELVPDLVVEIKSQSDRIPPIQQKLQQYLEQGAQVAMLIDPDEQTVTVYRPTGEPLQLQGDETLTIPELLPGWQLLVSELWPPIFEENE